MSETIYDLIIIGGGPAGLTAGIYASREGMSALVLEKGMCGGQVAITGLVENYPGFPDGINGMELIKKFKAQAQRFGVKISELTQVKSLQPLDGKIKVETDKQKYLARTIIITAGALPKRLDIPGEKELTGKGVSYCATCDGPLFRNKDVAIVGGGNAALEEALFLAKFAKKVILIHRRNELRGAKILQDQLQKMKNVEFFLNYNLVSINGETCVDSIVAKEKQTGKQKTIKVQGVFIYIGFLPNSLALKGIIDLDNEGYVKTDEKMKTSMPGVYAAGDIRSKDIRQISTACGDGTIAALSVREYLKP